MNLATTSRILPLRFLPRRGAVRLRTMLRDVADAFDLRRDSADFQVFGASVPHTHTKSCVPPAFCEVGPYADHSEVRPPAGRGGTKQ